MAHAVTVEIRDIHASYGALAVLKGVSCTILRNERWAVIGRNGTGKSTLIKIVVGLMRQESGSVFVNGTDIRKCPVRARARMLAYVPQKPDGLIPYTVEDFVMLGRYGAMGVLGVPSGADFRAVREAVDICDIRHLAGRLMSTLSGGELQRALLAGAVAQQTDLLLLDEPTTFLDPAHERLFFDALARLHEHRDLTVIMVTHDINTAIAQCTHICALVAGIPAFRGTTADFAAQCPRALDRIYGVGFERYVSGNDAPVFGAWGRS
jgi:iron complex transport system ATP-binding protein